jgi:uncharacterized YccA/Bax inhibitor family protein
MADWLKNPAVRQGSFDESEVGPQEAKFSVAGVALKTGIMLAIMAATFFYTWNLTTVGYKDAFSAVTDGAAKTQIDIPGNVYSLAIWGCLGAFAVAMFTIFVQRAAPFTGPVYAALEGLALGAISAGFEAKYPGIVLEALASTFGVAAGMLFLYGTGILRPTQKFLIGLLAAMLGIIVLYTVDLVMLSFGSYVPVVHEGGTWGVVFSIFVVGVAALSLIVDFEDIRLAAEDKAPKWYEWYAGFGLMLGLVWLYLEILRLYAKTKE